MAVHSAFSGDCCRPCPARRPKSSLLEGDQVDAPPPAKELALIVGVPVCWCITCQAHAPSRELVATRQDILSEEISEVYKRWWNRVCYYPINVSLLCRRSGNATMDIPAVLKSGWPRGQEHSKFGSDLCESRLLSPRAGKAGLSELGADLNIRRGCRSSKSTKQVTA